MKPRLLFVVNDPGFFLSHRLPLAVAARAAGYDVAVATAPGDAVARIRAHGFEHHAIGLSRSGLNPVRELRTLWALWRLFVKLRPRVVHLVTIKPVLYGGLAARLAHVHSVVAAVSGLGFVFISSSPKARLLRAVVHRLYAWALGHPRTRVIFQNEGDRWALVDAGLVERERTTLIRGSGVSLDEYQTAAEPDGPPVVVMASRLLRDKGVVEYVHAARQVSAVFKGVRFRLVGDTDPGNPTSIGREEMARWRAEGIVDMPGHRSDIAQVLSAAHLVVLPSYREGLPKILIEAAACGRAVVTTDVAGCRDAIEPGITGLLVAPRDPEGLAAAILSLLRDPVRRRAMGRAGRSLAEREFGLEKVVAAHLDIYAELACTDPSP